MKASRADGCVKIKVVGVSGRTHGRKASIDNEKKSVERKEKESTCVMETEGYSDISVMEKQGDQKPIMENISVMEKEGNQKAVMENLTVTEKGGHQDTVMENHSVMEKSVSSDPVPPVGSTCKEVMMKKEGDQTTMMENQNVTGKSVSSDSNASGTIPIKDYVTEKPEPSTPEASSQCTEVMTKKEGDQTTVMENQNVMEKSVSTDSNASATVLDIPIKDYVTEKPELSSPEASSRCTEVMTKKEGDQTTMMENQNVMEKSVSTDSNASATVLDIPIKDYVMEKPDLSSPEASSRCKEVMMEKDGDQTAIMENQNVMEKSVSSDSNASGTVLDRPVKDYVMEKPVPSTQEASTCKEVKKGSRKTDCNKKRSSLQINPKNFY